jgi:hypothetical protein
MPKRNPNAVYSLAHSGQSLEGRPGSETIVESWALGEGIKSIARRFKVSRNTVKGFISRHAGNDATRRFTADKYRALAALSVDQMMAELEKMSHRDLIACAKASAEVVARLDGLPSAVVEHRSKPSTVDIQAYLDSLATAAADRQSAAIAAQVPQLQQPADRGDNPGDSRPAQAPVAHAPESPAPEASNPRGGGLSDGGGIIESMDPPARNFSDGSVNVYDGGER